MSKIQRLNCLFALAAVCPAVYGVPVQIGSLAYDTALSGNHIFRILNLTGDPLSGGFASAIPGLGDPPPDFPVYTPITFQNASVSAVVQDLMDFTLETVVLPSVNLLPGIYDSNDPLVYDIVALEFDPLSDGVTQIELSFTVDPLLLTFYDGTEWTVDIGSLPIQVILLPGLTYLQPGDLVPIFVEMTQTQAVPEPRSITLGVLGLLAAGLLRRRIRRGSVNALGGSSPSAGGGTAA